MKIVRDGKEYELTENELIQAWNEVEDRNMMYDIKDEFDAIARDYEMFDTWRKEHDEEYTEMLNEAFDNCKFREEMYGNVNTEDAAWDTIEDHELGNLFE